MWYSVSILLKGSLRSGHKLEASWEEDIILCNTTSVKMAKKKAEIVGRGLECEYVTATGEYLRWKYDGILSINQLETDNIEDSNVVFSRYLRDEEILSLKRPFED